MKTRPSSRLAPVRAARCALVLVATSALALGLAACTSDDGPGGEKTESPAAPELPKRLEKVWGISVAEYADIRQLRTGDALVVSYEDTLQVLGLADGKVRHDVALPDGLRVCRLSETSTADGLAAVGLGRGEGCREVAVLDTASGRLLWHHRVPGLAEGTYTSQVAIGDRVVTTQAFCGEVRRYDARTGRQLSVIFPRDRVCGHSADLTGQWVVGISDPESPGTPAGEGIIPPYDGVAHLEMYDADTGKRLWRRPVDRSGAELESVVSTEPLVLDTNLEGERLMHRYDSRTGERGVLVGRPLGSSGQYDDFTVVSQESDRLVGHPGAGGPTYAYDLRTGQQTDVLQFEGSSSPVGAPGGLLTGKALATTAGRPDGPTVLVNRVDPARPGRPETLGWIDREMLNTAVYDDLLVVAGNNDLIAYRLPAEGEFRPDLLAADTPGLDDDTRPFVAMDHPDMCTHVPTSALETLRMRADLPAPYNCLWSRNTDAGADAVLQVGAGFVTHPRAALTSLRAENVNVEDAERRAVRGLGDEAWVVTEKSESSASVYMGVAYENLVVWLSYRQHVFSDAARKQVPTAAEAEAALKEAARGMIAELDATAR